MGQGQPGEPGAHAGFVAWAGAAAQQVIGQPGVAEGVFQHVAQRPVQVRRNNGNFGRVQTALGHQLHQRLSQLDDHFAPVAAADGTQDGLLRLGKRFGGVHELVFYQAGQVGQRRVGDKRLLEVEGVGAEAAEFIGPQRIGGEEAFVTPGGIVSNGRCHRFVHQFSYKILPGGGLLLDVVDDEVTVGAR